MFTKLAKNLSRLLLFLSVGTPLVHAQAQPEHRTNAALPASIGPGVSRELARSRAARIVGIRYELEYTLTPHAESAPGHEELMFKVTTPGPLLLDFREDTISKVLLNGKEIPAKIENGHIVLPAELLKISPNAAATVKKPTILTDNLGRPIRPDAVVGGIEALPQFGPERDDNDIQIDFTAPIAAAGKALTRFEDKDDGSEYIYTLFVPMDASMAFPCFDQPDLKAKLKLTVTAPEDWVVVSNMLPAETSSIRPGIRRTQFEQTAPISTYLFAFAAGPFFRINGDLDEGIPNIYVRQSQAKRAQQEAAEVQDITAKGAKYLADYFDQPFPFDKYELVLIPGFAYGGMEHAGATFLREESVLFRTAPTHSDHINRDLLLLHELTHQWFGDEVTMRWFDDLWLKEGFAQYMAYQTLAGLKPDEHIWKRFYQQIKPAAYAIDGTRGTTPIYQDIANLKDAKSAYGAIVYSKAPGVMRQLAFVIGEDKFQQGLQQYLKDHSFANAQWSDLVHALEKASGKSLQAWADAYIRRRGMPQVDVDWSCSAQGTINHFALRQHNVLNEGGLWPIATEILLSYPQGKPERIKVQFDTATANVKEAMGKPCPQWVFANDQDYAYGRFLLDARSRKAVIAQLGGISDVFERTLLWGSLWDSVREAQMDPKEYVELALKLLPQEKDETLAQNTIGHMVTALHRYVTPQVRAQLAPKAEALAYDQMLHAPEQDMRIIWFRGLRSVAETQQGRGYLKDLLSGKLSIPGVELRQLDRWNIVTSLIGLNDPDAAAVLAAEETRDPSGEGRKYAYMAQAAAPQKTNKRKYFTEYLHDASLPEDWVEQSLAPFNYWNQSQLTLPYLKPALNALPQVKRNRKIFFMLAWLNAFIDGQQSPQAQAEVRNFLKTRQLDKDLRLKILEVSDELDRTVKIHARYGAGEAAHVHAKQAASTAAAIH